MIYLSILNIFKFSTDKTKKYKYRHLKYICTNCGAYNRKYQGFCGICMSKYLKKATKKDVFESIKLIEDLIEVSL